MTYFGKCLEMGKMATPPNRAYLATVLRTSAQICSANAPETSDTLVTLSEIPRF